MCPVGCHASIVLDYTAARVFGCRIFAQVEASAVGGGAELFAHAFALVANVNCVFEADAKLSSVLNIAALCCDAQIGGDKHIFSKKTYSVL